MLLLLQIFLFTVFIKKKKLAADHDLCFWQVIIKFGDREINKSPFSVKVEGAAGDPTKVTASGPGLEKTGVIATKRTYFEVFTKSEFILCLAVCLFFLIRIKFQLKFLKTILRLVKMCHVMQFYDSFIKFHVFTLHMNFLYKKKNASQRELTQSWFMCISLSISIYSWNVIQWVGRLVLWVCADLFW